MRERSTSSTRSRGSRSPDEPRDQRGNEPLTRLSARPDRRTACRSGCRRRSRPAPGAGPGSRSPSPSISSVNGAAALGRLHERQRDHPAKEEVVRVLPRPLDRLPRRAGRPAADCPGCRSTPRGELASQRDALAANPCLAGHDHGDAAAGQLHARLGAVDQHRVARVHRGVRAAVALRRDDEDVRRQLGERLAGSPRAAAAARGWCREPRRDGCGSGAADRAGARSTRSSAAPSRACPRRHWRGSGAGRPRRRWSVGR